MQIFIISVIFYICFFFSGWIVRGLILKMRINTFVNNREAEFSGATNKDYAAGYLNCADKIKGML